MRPNTSTKSIFMKILFCSFLLIGVGFAQTQRDYYIREEIPLPEGETMEISSIAIMDDDQVAVATRRGDIWICTGAYAEDLSEVTWHKYAHGLHEPLGMFFQDKGLVVTQRPELTRVSDENEDGFADSFETINSDWGISGDYHEYAFGSPPDKNGDVWITLCLTGSFTGDATYRGWALRIKPDGTMVPAASGIRSPGGMGLNADSDVFYTDNQGPWNGSSSLKWLKQDSFQGNPSGNKFHELTGLPAPPEPADKSRIRIEREKFPSFIPPAVVFPHAKLGQSPSGITLDATSGKFGPWKDQLYVGEQTHSQVQRVALEKVNGIYQGVAFPFLDGFEAGLIPVVMDQEKAVLFVGGSNRGWASRGSKPFTFERVRPTGEIPFEILTMTANSDGFTLQFTEAVDAKIASDPASYELKAWTYILQAAYGSPEVDQSTPVVSSVELAEDNMSVRLKVDQLVKGHVHHLHTPNLKSAKGVSLWHSDAYYTLNEIPDEK